MKKTLAEYQKNMPKKLKAEHDAMSKAACIKAEKDLRHASMKCHYFGNDCPVRGPDGLMQMSDNLAMRADYFKLLAESKP